MNAFDEFIMSDAFFPVVIVLLVLLITVFIIITVNNKRKYGPFRNIKNASKPEIDYSSEVHIINDLSPVEEVKANEFDEILNINNIVEADDNYLKPRNVEEEKKLQVNDSSILASSNAISFNSFDNSQRSETEEMPIDKSSEVTSNLQDDDKFMADVHTFPDFSDIEDKDKKEENKNSRIEEDVMDAASKYIESIMSNNSRWLMKTEFENVYLEYVDELNKKNVKDKMSKEELLKKLEETQRINL